MAQQLASFTIRMMEGVIRDHAGRTSHDQRCCALAAEYRNRLGMAPSQAPTAPVPTPRQAPQAEVRPITKPMAKYIKGLRRKVSLDLISPRHRELVKIVCDDGEISFKDGRELIEALKSLADQTVTRGSYVEPSYIPEEGAYLVDGTFYLVTTSKETKRRYAKKFDADNNKFHYDGQSSFHRLTEDCRVTAEEAKAFGDQYHRCCNCGIKLTRAKSIEHGYGPVCAENNGWPY